MPNIFDSTSESSCIISKEEYLLPDYVPDEVLHRSSEIEFIANSIKPIISRKTPENIFIHGKPGTGKTMCLKYVIKQLLSHTSSVLPVYVNCWENNTKLAIFNRIVEEMKLPLPRRGMASDEIFDRILQYIKNYNKKVLLVLDDMDGLSQQELLYVIAKSNEKGVMFGIIGVSNDKFHLAKLDDRVRSSLRFSELEFQSYSEEQLFQILKTRSFAALSPSCFDDKLLQKIARHVSDGSARFAIELLWKSAKRAETAGHLKIMLQDFEDVVNTDPSFKLGELGLTAEESLVLSTISSYSSGIESSELYSKLEPKLRLTKRQIRNYLTSLEEKGLIDSISLESNSIIKPRILKAKRKL
ncbi:MAG: Cdc6/Cdc18 family protein [Candidatus Bilamarchaeum sp.]